jgi:hypothetical protein
LEELHGQNGSLVKYFKSKEGVTKGVENFLRSILIVFQQKQNLYAESSKVLTLWLNLVATKIDGKVPDPILEKPTTWRMDLTDSETNFTFEYLSDFSAFCQTDVCHCKKTVVTGTSFEIECSQDIRDNFISPVQRQCKKCETIVQRYFGIPSATWLFRLEVNLSHLCKVMPNDPLFLAGEKSKNIIEHLPKELTFQCGETNAKFHLSYCSVRREFGENDSHNHCKAIFFYNDSYYHYDPAIDWGKFRVLRNPAHGLQQGTDLLTQIVYIRSRL